MTDMSGMGRIHKPDERDKKYMMQKPAVPATRTSQYWISKGEALDQGGTSQCVVYSGDKWLTTYPVSNPSFGSNADRERVYKEVQELDEWDGSDYDGTSVRALFKYLKAQGVCSEYQWAFDAETVVAHLLMKGPVILGTNWYMEMFVGDRLGYIQPEGEVTGGHAYLAIGANRKKRNPDGTVGAVRILNSWGNWNQEGRAWITFAHLDKLIKEDGEAGVAIEVKKKPVT